MNGVEASAGYELGYDKTQASATNRLKPPLRQQHAAQAPF